MHAARSGAIGDPTTITGTGTYSVGNNNGTIAANNSGVFGNDNTITGALDGVRVIGNTNTVSASGAMVIGSNSQKNKTPLQTEWCFRGGDNRTMM